MSGLEDKTIEIATTEQNKEKRMKRRANRQSTWKRIQSNDSKDDPKSWK